MKRLSRIAVTLVAPFMLAVGTALPTVTRAATPPAILEWQSSVPGWDNSYYWYDTDQHRYAFSSTASFQSWFPGNPTGVLTAGIPELSQIVLNGAVYHRPGTRLLKFSSSPDVYAVARYGILRKLATEQVALELYGTTWKSTIDELPVTDYSLYRFGSTITDAAEYDPAAYDMMTNPSSNVVNAANRPPESFNATIALSTDRTLQLVGDTMKLTATVSNTRDAWNTVTIRFYDHQDQVIQTCRGTLACSVDVTVGGPIGDQDFTARAFNTYEESVVSEPILVTVRNP